METTFANLLILIQQESAKLGEIKDKIRKNSTITKDKEIESGKETLLQDVENFDDLMAQYNVSSDKLVYYKNMLNKENNSTMVEKDETISDVINIIKELRSRLSLLDTLSYKQTSRDRRFDGNGGYAYYRVVELNFNMDDINILREETKNEISRLEALIQNVNATTVITI